MTLFRRLLFLAWVSLMIVSCDDNLVDAPFENQPPTVSVFILSDSVVSLNRTSSRQILHWDGKDSDGLVVGFYYTFGNSSDIENWVFLPDSIPAGPELINNGIPNWRFTTERTDSFFLSILTDTVTYVFSVLAVDNEGSLSEEPAKLVLPIKNSNPEFFFLGEADTANSTVIIPDTTFTIISFAWSVSDLDGEETIDKFQYAITSPGDSLTEASWVDIPPNKRSIILSGTTYETEADVTFDSRLTEGDHAFYLRVIDAAGAMSEVKRLPGDKEKFWHVKNPVGEIIIIDDWASPASGDGLSLYSQALTTHGRTFSVLDIKPQNTDFLLSKVALVETIKLFKAVIWYSDAKPSLVIADAALRQFNNNGGKVIFSTLFSLFESNQGDPLGFTPVDSVKILLKPDSTIITAIFKSWNISIWPDTSLSLTEFPDTLASDFLFSILSSPKEIVPKASARVLYRYQENPDRYIGAPVIMVEDANKSFVVTSVPLHYFNGNNKLSDLIERILTQEFGL